MALLPHVKMLFKSLNNNFVSLLGYQIIPFFVMLANLQKEPFKIWVRGFPVTLI